MDTSNHWYGHAHILSEYCGLPFEQPRPIWGVLQHGWNLLHGFGPGHEPPYGFPKFVWSHANLRRGQAVGWRDYAVIGAPWNYLLDLKKDVEPIPPADEREGTIFYPFHTWDHGEVSGDHDRLIAEIRDTEEGPVTVCLYWIEYDMPEIRRRYEDVGFRVICHGKRGTLRQGTDIRFLHKQYAEQIRHRRVASNRLTTAIFYGASVGAEVAVYGDPMTFADVRDASVRDGNEQAKRLFPEFHGVETDAEEVRATTVRELGLDAMASPAELRALFGWEITG